MSARRQGVGWKTREDDALRGMFCTLAYDPQRIAEELDRSIGSVRSRIRLLGLKPSSIKKRPVRRELFRELFK